MKNYLFCLKIYEATDYEREVEVEAETEEEAVKKIREKTGRILKDWDNETLLKNIGEIKVANIEIPNKKIGGCGKVEVLTDSFPFC